jgi:tripartite ATP-independent transporter DctM subunit
MDTFILIASFGIFCAIGVPVAYALGLSAIATALWVDIPLQAVMIKSAEGVSKFSLLAIPFFVTTGALMAEGGTARRLVALAQVFVGFIRGGLAMVNVVAQTLFGCISGSSVADTASIGSVMIPQMIKQGYPRVFATNVTICGSLQAILLPPSHNAVIYSLAAGGSISIAHLFLAGIVPGVMLGISILLLVLFMAYKKDLPRGETVSFKEALKIGLEAIWGLMTVVIILGGILSGVFTATEAGSIACIYALFVSMFIYREARWRDLPRLFARVSRTVGMVMIMIGFSVAFAYLMALIRLPTIATEFFLSISDNKYVFLLLINILLLILGTFMDLAPMLLICTPILLPVILKFGIDPIHFGMVMLLNLGIGLVTPPVGPTMVVGCAIGRVSMEQITKELWPFYLVMTVVLLLVTYVPAISLWLPSFVKL